MAGFSDYWQQSLPWQDAVGARALDAWIPGLGVAAQPVSQAFWSNFYEDDGGVDWITGPGATVGAGGAAGGPGFRAPDIANNAQIDRYAYGDILAQAQARDAGLAGQQGTFLDTLTARAEGRGGPSLAEMQLQQSLAQNQANAAGLMASQRGMSPALAARMVGNQQAGMAQSAAGQGAMLRAQEQLAAQQLLGQSLAGFRGQEQNLFGMGVQGQQGQNALAGQMGAQDADRRMRLAELESDDAYRRQKAEIERLTANRGFLGQDLLPAAQTFMASGMMGGGGNTSTTQDPQRAQAGGMAEGGKVPGQAPHPGKDTPSNDVTLGWLTPGEIVLPLSVVDSDDPGEEAKAFVEACLAKAAKGKKGGK